MLQNKNIIRCSFTSSQDDNVVVEGVVEIFEDDGGDQIVCIHNNSIDGDWSLAGRSSQINYSDYPKKLYLDYYDHDEYITDIELIGKYGEERKIESIRPARELVLDKAIGDFKKGTYLILSNNDVETLISYGAHYKVEWNPSMLWVGDKYYYIDADGKIKDAKFDNTPKTTWRVKNNNCFETKIKAEIYHQKIIEGGIEM